MLASPEAARFVLVTHSHLFKPTYPKSKEKLIGSSALFFHQGDYHTRIRKLVQTSLSPESIKKLIPDIETQVISSLESWVSVGQVINAFCEMKKFSFNIGILSVFGNLENNYREQLKENYSIVEKGYNSFPTRIPGTAYSKALLARKRIHEIISEIICKKREQKLIEKYLHDDQKLLEAVKAEQMSIYEANERGKIPLSWNQTRNMPITHRVILESLRMSSIISFTFREAVVDVVYKGYLIPKGWKVMPLFRNIHHNPEFYIKPQSFDPSRFEVSPKPYTFMPFGNGVHSCPGNELAKLNMLILIHHLVTKFRWEVEGYESGVEYSPFPIPMHGLPTRFLRD
ncbi:hypothetical protein RYX36_034707 [Vicia faba]